MLKCKQELAKGLWIDEQGQIHFSIPDILEALGIEYTEENKKILEDAIRQGVTDQIPDVKFVKLHSCPNCGLVGSGPHGPGCPL